MDRLIEKYKGIHPGLILERELKKRNLKQAPFALSLKVYPQTLNAITKGKRAITPELSLKIDQALGLEEGTMHILQAYYEIQKARLENSKRPDLSILRKALFWDADIAKIDWEQQYKSVIKRVFERGNLQEKEEIISFYGKEKVKEIVGSANATDKLELPFHNKNVE